MMEAKTNSIMILEGKAPDTLCDNLIELITTVEKTNPSTIVNSEEHYGGSHYRKDFALFLQDISNDLCTQVNQILNDSLIEYTNIFGVLKNTGLRSIQQKLQYTPIGGGYHIWHFENDAMSVASRILTWTIYLNDVEEGGETEFLYQHKRVKAEKGNILIFPASFTHTHRGNPPISGDKYILTGWWNLFE